MTDNTMNGADASDVTAAASAARALIASVRSPVETGGSSAEWAAALGELQALADIVAAAQDEAIVRLAAIEPVALETGEVVDTHRAPGHVALDAPAIVSGVLAVSAVHAERRVRDAVRRAADGPAGTDTCTGLGGLHAAMAAGRLDPYRAEVVAHELEEVPAEVAAGVVESVAPWFAREDAPRLRRRVRRVLARDLPRPAAPARRAGPRHLGAAPLGGRAGCRHLARDLPVRGGLRGVGGGRLPRPAVRRGRHLRARRAGPGQGADRPRDVERHRRAPRPVRGAGRCGRLALGPGTCRPASPTTSSPSTVSTRVTPPRPPPMAGAGGDRRRPRRPGGAPGHRRPARRRRPPRHRRLPARHPPRRARPGAGRALPLPRVSRRRPVLRPRPRPPLAGGPHLLGQPRLPVPAAPPRQAAPGLVGTACRRRDDDLDRPHRSDPADHSGGPPRPRPARCRHRPATTGSPSTGCSALGPGVPAGARRRRSPTGASWVPRRGAPSPPARHRVRDAPTASPPHRTERPTLLTRRVRGGDWRGATYRICRNVGRPGAALAWSRRVRESRDPVRVSTPRSDPGA